jgi:hypothetical protein
MLHPETRTLQTVAGCRWSRPGYRRPGTPVDETEPLWVCVRPTATIVRRPVAEEECANCLRWEMNAEIDD